MRLRVAVAAACLLSAGLSAADGVEAAIRKTTNIPAQGLGPALQTLAKDHGFQIVYVSDELSSLRTQGALGELTRAEALTKLLSGTGLTYRSFGNNAISIISNAAGASPSGDVNPTSSNVGTDREVKESSGWFRRLRLAQNDQTSPAPGNSSVSSRGGIYDSRNPLAMEEIIVTAQKRSERLVDTPQSVTVLSSDTLSNIGATRFRDFAATVPGLSFQTAGPGWTQISLRGITAGFDVSPTVGVYVDDVPYGSSNSAARGGQLALDVAPFDLDRIEVLRGPQGTLYGASTMGGLIKYVTKEPSTAELNGFVTAGLSGTDHGGSNYKVTGGINAPLNDWVAIRASAYETHEDGYIDNLALGREDVNSSDIYGGRLDVLLSPSTRLNIRLNGLVQNTDTDGFPFSERRLDGVPVNDRLVQSRPSPEGFDQQFQLVSGTFTYDFGPSTLTSISSYQEVDSHFDVDISPVFLSFARTLGTVPLSAVGTMIDTSTNKFTQEVRLSSNGNSVLEWIVGAYYTSEDSDDRSDFLTLDAAGQPTPNNILANSNPSDQEEQAAFGDVTWNLTEKFDITGGLRFARTKTEFSQVQSGVLSVPPQEVDSSDDVVTYLANARYSFGERSSAYVRYATGYRPGGPNFLVLDPNTGEPFDARTFDSDKLKSYEVGFRAETPERRFGIDVGAYYIDWENIQVTTSRSGFVIRRNAPGGATSRGADLMLMARPIEGLAMTGTVAYQDAYMNEAVPNLRAAKGERLPNVPRLTTSFNADYRFTTRGNLTPSVGTTVAHVGERRASYDASTSPPQYQLPSYTKVDVRLGMELGTFSTQLYVHNLTDDDGEIPPRLSGATPAAGPYALGVIQPRTYGVSVSNRF